MEFRIRKSGVLVLKRTQIVKIEGFVLLKGKVVTKIDESGYKYLGILETDQLKEKKLKTYSHRNVNVD